MTNLTHPWNISSQYCCCCCITLVMSDSVQPHRRQPTRLCRPWDSPGKNTGVGCHFLPQGMKVKSESEVAQSCPSLATPLTAAHQAPPSMGFSRQEYWSGVPLPSPLVNIRKSINIRHYIHRKGETAWCGVFMTEYTHFVNLYFFQILNALFLNSLDF